MKIPRAAAILFIGLMPIAWAQNLPPEAQRIIEKLTEYENDERIKNEQEIIKEKRDLIRSLERSEKRIESDDTKRIYKWQINKLEDEIELSEKFIKGEAKHEDLVGNDDDDDENEHENVKPIVKFDVAYDYKNPMEFYTDQSGELVFFKDNRVKLTHKNPNGEIVYEHIVRWEQKNLIIVIHDEVHGRMFVRNRGDNDNIVLRLVWTKLKKSIPLTLR